MKQAGGGGTGNLASVMDARSAIVLKETEKPFIVFVLIMKCPDCPGQIEYTFWTVWASWPDRCDSCCVLPLVLKTVLFGQGHPSHCIGGKQVERLDQVAWLAGSRAGFRVQG